MKSVISFVILLYLILATGPSPKVRLLPWLIWGQLALDALLFVLWLAAGSTSSYNCNDLCNACSGFSELYYDNLYCLCFDNVLKRDSSPVRRGPLMPRTPRSRGFGGNSNSDDNSGGGSTADARKAFDAIVTYVFAPRRTVGRWTDRKIRRVIFFVCVVADLFWIFQASKSTSTTATTSAPAGSMPAKQEETGATTAAAGIPLNDQQQGANAGYYGGQPMQQQGGYQQQPVTHGQYPEGQYPPQYAQGQPQQQYTQTQAVPQHQHDVPQGNYVSPKDGTSEVYSPGAEGGHPTMVTK